MTDNLKTWPERIYLNHTDGEGPMSYDEAMRYEDVVTWCDVRQEKADVEYVRADLTAAHVVAQNDRLAGLRRLMGYVQDGSDTTVRLYQDDACQTFHVAIGPANKMVSYWGDSFEEAIDMAVAALPKVTG